jgi:hypothetical protein
MVRTEDVRHLLQGGPVAALAPTSQEAGNQTDDNSEALTAPGSQPPAHLADRDVPVDPTVRVSPLPGPPRHLNRGGDWTASPPAWKRAG